MSLVWLIVASSLCCTSQRRVAAARVKQRYHQADKSSIHSIAAAAAELDVRQLQKQYQSATKSKTIQHQPEGAHEEDTFLDAEERFAKPYGDTTPAIAKAHDMSRELEVPPPQPPNVSGAVCKTEFDDVYCCGDGSGFSDSCSPEYESRTHCPIDSKQMECAVSWSLRNLGKRICQCLKDHCFDSTTGDCYSRLSFFFVHEYHRGQELSKELPYKMVNNVRVGQNSVPTYLNPKTDVHVFAVPIDLCRASDGRGRLPNCTALFHYTDFKGFANIASPSSTVMEVWAGLRNQEGKNLHEQLKGIKYGEGVYAVSKDPDSFDSKREILINNYSNKPSNDTGNNKTLMKREGRADYCIVLVVPRENVYNIQKELPPDMKELTPERRVGYTLKGDRLRTDRDLWVVQVREQGQITNPSVSLEQHWRLVVSQQQKTLGKDHLLTLNSMSDFANALQARGKFEEAEHVNRRILKAREDLYWSWSRNHNHNKTLSAMNNLAITLSKRGKHNEAEQLQRRTLSQRKWRGNEKNRLTNLNNLARVLLKQERFHEAALLSEVAFKGRERIYGTDYPGTLTSMSNLGLALGGQGKLQEAEELHRRALQEREKILGPKHSNTLHSVNNLARLLEKLDRLQEAEKLHRRTFSGRDEKLGSQHPSTLKSISYLARVLERQGKSQEAERLQWLRRRVAEDETEEQRASEEEEEEEMDEEVIWERTEEQRGSTMGKYYRQRERKSKEHQKKKRKK